LKITLSEVKGRQMARPLRIEYEGAFYHVTAGGNERKKIFLSKRDHEKFLQYLKEAQDKNRFILHAYVKMGTDPYAYVASLSRYCPGILFRLMLQAIRPI
jgi:hypothetical protein